MNNVKIRRFTAYCLDLIIVTLIATGLFQIKALHPNADKYESTYKEYSEYVNKVMGANSDEEKEEAALIVYFDNSISEDDTKTLEDKLNEFDNVTDTKLVTKDNISEDEEDKVILLVKDYFEENADLNAYILSINDSTKIDDIIKDIKKLDNVKDTIKYTDEDEEKITPLEDMTTKERKAYIAKTGAMLRDVDFYGISYNVCWIAVIILYFTLFPYFNKGMTIGKRVVRLKVVRSDDENKKVKLWQHFVKAIICPIYTTGALSNCFTFIVMIITPLVLDGANFAYATTYINLAISLLCYIDVFMIAFRKDGLGISDKLARVKVIDYVRNQEDN